MLKRRVQFFESYWKKKSSILWLIFSKRVQFFESHSILRVNFFLTKRANLWVRFLQKKKSVQFFESYFLQKGSILGVKLRKGFNSLRHIWKKKFSAGVLFAKRVQKSNLKKKVQVFESCLKKSNYLSHNEKKSSILWILIAVSKVPFLRQKKRFNSMSHVEKKGSNLWIVFLWKKLS